MSEINEVIERVIRSIAEQKQLSLPRLGLATEIVDELGFTSWAVAALIANLEDELGVDPFQEEDVMITDIRTIGDLCEVYENSLAGTR